MKALVVYESMYGNTHLIASAVADGLRPHGDATVVRVDEADPELVESADVIVVGGPTHAHGMSRASTRKAAAVASGKPGSNLVLEAERAETSLREWFASVNRLDKKAAAFDTRIDMAAVLTGRASKGIARELRQRGATLISEPRSFFVTKDNHLEPHEESEAREWGARLAKALD
jgi:menaquinone-dependent protoporphyrinogen IX oxidase